MVDITGSYDPNAEAQTEFEPIPTGKYAAVIEQADMEDISRNNDYGSCLKLTWKITEGEYENRLIWQRLSLWGQNMNNNDKVIHIANTQMAAIREATGVMTPQNTDELLHIPCRISVGIRKDKSGQYPDQNDIKGVKPLAGQESAKKTPFRPAPQKPVAAQSAQKRPWPRPSNVDEVPF